MEEIEVPLEKGIEHIQENAIEHGGWFGRVALSTAMIAVIAAIAALMAGHHSNEALISEIQSSDLWAHYQAKGIKSSILTLKTDLFTEMGKKVKEEDKKKQIEYSRDKEELAEKAREKAKESEHHLKSHIVLANSVTFFQISIAISAIAVLTRRKSFWMLSLVIAFGGFLFFIKGWLFI